MKRFGYLFEEITAFENLREAAKSASSQKRNQRDIVEFLINMENEIITLQNDLILRRYEPGEYSFFTIQDPKERQICVAPFRDRVLHQAICKILDPVFSLSYIHDSYACRRDKGTHKALEKAQDFCKRYSFFLKCDIRKFYESIDHEILISILKRRIKDEKVIDLLCGIINSCKQADRSTVGLPIGNLTSQHFANLYLDRFDHFVKEDLKCRAYLRYMDDFILFGNRKAELRSCLSSINSMLEFERKLRLKESATIINNTINGIPFLGFSVYPNLKRVRRTNLKRFLKRVRCREKQFLKGLIDKDKLIRSVSSSVAYYSHGNTLKLRKKMFAQQSFDL